MAVIPTPEQGKPILDFSAGTFDGSSNLFQSRNGATEHVNGDDVADYVNTSRLYNTLDTESKTPVGAINEVNRKDASDIPYDNTASGLTATDVQAAIDELDEKTGSDIAVSSSSTETIADAISALSVVSRYSATGSAYGSFSFKEINGIKFVLMRNLTGLAANALTTLDFTLPETMRPIEDICYLDVRQPSSDYTVRLIINPSGVVQIYNYGSTTGALNVSFIGSYI